MPRGMEQRKRVSTAEKRFLAILEKDPSDTRTYVSLGTLYERQRRPEEARRIYEAGCAVAEGGNPHLWTALGNLERKERNFQQARKYFDAALVASPSHTAAYHGFAMAERAAGNDAGARDILLKGIKATTAKRAGAGAGVAAERSGEGSADGAGGQATAEASPYMYDALGNLAADVGRLEEARFWFRTGTNTRRGAQSNALWSSWGTMEWKQANNHRAASYCFEMAIRTHHRNRYAHLSLAQMERSLGNSPRARTLLERAMELNPTDAALAQAYGVLLEELGEHAEARRAFSRAIRIDPTQAHAWQAWGVMERRLGRIDHARRLFQKGLAYTRSPTSKAYLYQAWGILESRAGNLAEARALFRSGLAAAPRNAAVWNAWIELELRADLLNRADELTAARDAALASLHSPSISTLPGSAARLPIVDTVMRWVTDFRQGEEGNGKAGEGAAPEGAPLGQAPEAGARRGTAREAGPPASVDQGRPGAAAHQDQQERRGRGRRPAEASKRAGSVGGTGGVRGGRRGEEPEPAVPSGEGHGRGGRVGPAVHEPSADDRSAATGAAVPEHSVATGGTSDSGLPARPARASARHAALRGGRGGTPRESTSRGGGSDPVQAVQATAPDALVSRMPLPRSPTVEGEACQPGSNGADREPGPIGASGIPGEASAVPVDAALPALPRDDSGSAGALDPSDALTTFSPGDEANNRANGSGPGGRRELVGGSGESDGGLSKGQEGAQPRGARAPRGAGGRDRDAVPVAEQDRGEGRSELRGE